MKKFLKITAISLACIITTAVIFGVLFYYGAFSEMSQVKLDSNMLKGISTPVQLYDMNDDAIIDQPLLTRQTIKLKDLPKHTIDAFISSEDKVFYKHNGINYKRIASAIVTNLKSSAYKEGGSTITQQLIKNTHLSSEKTLSRKFNEILLAQKLEKNFSKNEILECYLNVIYFGSGAYGIEQASRRFFDKGAGELDINESAILAAVIKSPRYYSPIYYPDASKKRRNVVLNEMKKDGKITNAQYKQLKKLPLNLKLNERELMQNTYTSYSIKEACELLKISEKELALKGYKIHTYLDDTAQNGLQSLIEDDENLQRMDCDNLAVVLDNTSGALLACFGQSRFNLKNIKRQPGSCIKPVISYAPAIEYGKVFTCSKILDEKTHFENYTPSNYNNKYYGWTTVKQSLAKSLNVPSIKLMEYVGINKCKAFAGRCGIKFGKDDKGYSLALGGFSEGVGIIDLAGSYLPFSNGGKYYKPTTIKRIENKYGSIVYQHSNDYRQVMGDDTAYLVTDMLKEGVKTGTARKLSDLGFEVAAKTGTVGSDKTNSDAYNIAYTSKNTVCVWLGNTSSDSSKNLPQRITGAGLPTELSKDILKLLDNNPPPFKMPQSICQRPISTIEHSDNNKVILAGVHTPERYVKSEFFSSRHLPKYQSVIFSDIDDFDITAHLNGNKAIITVPTKKYLSYQVFRKHGDNVELIAALSNKVGQQEIFDELADKNKFYEYYAVAMHGNFNKCSNKVKVYFVSD